MYALYVTRISKFMNIFNNF